MNYPAGIIRKPYALKGELKTELYFKGVDQFLKNQQAFVDEEEIQIEYIKKLSEAFLIKIKGFSTPEEAAVYRGKEIFVNKNQLEVFLAEKELLPNEMLLGYQVFNFEGEKIGKIEEIIKTGANDVFAVLRDREEILVPDIKEYVLGKDYKDKKIIIKIPEYID